MPKNKNKKSNKKKSNNNSNKMPKKKKKGAIQAVTVHTEQELASAVFRFAATNAIEADKKTIPAMLSLGEWYSKSTKGKNNTFERRVIMTDGRTIRQTTSLSKTPSAHNAFKVQKKQLLKDEYWAGVSQIIIATVTISM